PACPPTRRRRRRRRRSRRRTDAAPPMPARPARTCRSAAAAGALWLQLAARLESTSPGGGASSTRWCDETLAGEGGSGYQGCQDRTVSGRLCQRWSAQSPQQHALTAESSPGKGL
ncbi:unnamed protein product, partial [Prorocentrum cordatum]